MESGDGAAVCGAGRLRDPRSRPGSAPPAAPCALSHYTIRIRAEIRNTVKDQLYANGINAITLWEFPYDLDKAQFPNTHRLSSEVLNLPLSVQLSNSDVDYVCDRLIQCFTIAPKL